MWILLPRICHELSRVSFERRKDETSTIVYLFVKKFVARKTWLDWPRRGVSFGRKLMQMYGLQTHFRRLQVNHPDGYWSKAPVIYIDIDEVILNSFSLGFAKGSRVLFQGIWMLQNFKEKSNWMFFSFHCFYMSFLYPYRTCLKK